MTKVQPIKNQDRSVLAASGTAKMFTKRIELFSLLGFRVRLDLSWFLLAILIVWSLSGDYFPDEIEGLDPTTSLILGIAGALGLFVSIILHECSHAIVARHYDIPIAGITLFIFGGVAEMQREPPSAKSEFLMAIAGPIASFLIAFVSFGISATLPEATPEAPVSAVFRYLGVLNLILAIFNLLPAFPLDGGRVFRAALWWTTGNLQKATETAARTGRLLGSFLVLLGVITVVSGNFVAGMWQALIGLFIIGAARSSELHMILSTVLEGVKVKDLMVGKPITVSAETTVGDVIEHYFYRYGHKVFPVIHNQTLLGCVRLEDIGRIPSEDRATLTAADVLSNEVLRNTVTPECSITKALETMQNCNRSRLMVVSNGRLDGILTMRDIMNYVSVRQQIAMDVRGAQMG